MQQCTVCVRQDGWYTKGLGTEARTFGYGKGTIQCFDMAEK